MSDTYVERIVKLIAEHRREIERLETALSVLGDLMEDAPVRKVKTLAAPVATAITIRKVADPVAKPAKRNGPLPSKEKLVWRDRVVAELRKQPQKSGHLIARYLPQGSSKNEKQYIYDALYALKTARIVERDGDGVYSLVTEDAVV